MLEPERERLDRIIQGQTIRIAILEEQVRLLAIENVKLINKPDLAKTRQYAKDFIPSSEPMRDNNGKRHAGGEDTLPA